MTARERGDPFHGFHPLFRTWFLENLGEPTPPQRGGWPAIQRGEHALILAPTGSGKTLSAFYACLNDLHVNPPAGEGVHTLYISPLKALNNDIHRNLRVPLGGIAALARDRGEPFTEPDVAVRTGDTPQRERARMIRHPPDVLITTPESLYLLLLGKSREILRTVRYVIVDEIHALLGGKRGAHLALSLERLVELTAKPPVRVGLSATVRPVEEAARFLGGYAFEGEGRLSPRPVTLVDARGEKKLDLAVHVPIRDYAEAGSEGVWPHVYPALLGLIRAHESTLVFANNRRLAERVAARLNELAAERNEGAQPNAEERSVALDGADVHEEEGDLVRAHHGSMARETRMEMEALLKDGRLPALVATSSLELGIDVGHVDLVALLESPKEVSRALQRVGRAGHLVGETSTGRFFPLHRDDLMECAALVRAIKQGRIEAVLSPKNPLDVLAQQIVAHVAAAGSSPVEDIYRVVRRAHPFREISRPAFNEVVESLAGKYPSEKFRHLKARLDWDRARGILHALPGTKVLAAQNAGTIPDRGQYACVLADDASTKVGELDEEFVYETRVGDVILLGSQTWRVVEIDHANVVVEPAPGEPPRMPFWRGEGVWRSPELSDAVSDLREAIGRAIGSEDARRRLAREMELNENAAENLFSHFERMKEETGLIPTGKRILVERFRDELGDPRLVIHNPLGGRLNGTWALALASKLRERLGTDVQAVHNDDAILLRFPDADAPGPREIARLVAPEEAEPIVLRELAGNAVFAARFRENAERALLLPRSRRGRTPLWLQRLRAADLLEVARGFEEFPILLETYRECLTEVLDVKGLERHLARIAGGEVQVVTRESAVPSPFAASLLFQFTATYLYEGDTARPEARAGSLQLNRELLSGLIEEGKLQGLLREEAVHEVETELARQARTPNELHVLLREQGPLTEGEIRARATDAEHLEALRREGRVRELRFDGSLPQWAAPEDLERFERLKNGDAGEARSLVARFLRARGPVGEGDVASRLGLAPERARLALHHLREEGAAVSGRFTGTGETEAWCDRENLARIHRRTLQHLRKQVKPVDFQVYQAYLLERHGIGGTPQPPTPDAIEAALRLLRGHRLPGETWEREIARARFRRFEPRHLDPLLRTGEIVWSGSGVKGRFTPLFRGEGHLLLPEATPLKSVGESRVREFLDRSGASFFSEIRSGTGLTDRDLVRALHQLVANGEVVSDDSDVVHHLLRHPDPPKAPKARGPLIPGLPPTPGPRSGPRRGAASGPYLSGRWSLARTPGILGPRREGEDRDMEVARVLLQRYGVLAKEHLDREDLNVNWGRLLRALKRMEMRGEARRGLFVRGLTGTQFALPDAVDGLRAERAALERGDAEAPTSLLSPVDPACAWAIGPSLPASERGRALKLSRQSGVHVALQGGKPVLLSEAWGERLTPIQGADEDALLNALRALRGLLDLPVGVRPRRRLTVRTWDGEAVLANDRARQLLLDAGFEVESGALVYSPHL